MRIIAGLARGARLLVPAGTAVRPTGGRAREALFSLLTSRGVFERAPVVLDLYAGTGALGLEALSRGAAAATLVESDPRVAALARENARHTHLDDRAQIVTAGVGAFLRSLPAVLRGRIDLAFLDPPYDAAGELTAALAALAQSGAMTPGAAALVCAERRRRDAPAPAPDGWQAADERRWGEAAVTLYARRSVPRAAGAGDGEEGTS